MFKQDKITAFVCCLIVFCFISIAGWSSGILHDNTIFVSNMCSDLMRNGAFRWGSLQEINDPGHPPLCATYLVMIWHLFGRSLAISHIALWPFILVCILMTWNIVGLFIKDQRLHALAFLIISIEPTFSASLTLIGPEVLLLTFALSAIYFMLLGKRMALIICLAFLGITSMRGMMVCAGLFLTDLCLHWSNIKKAKATFSAQYLTASIPGVAFVAWRLLDKGWITSNPVAFQSSVWPDGGIVGFAANFLHNCFVLARWYCDFGRIIPILILLAIMFMGRRSYFKDENVKKLIVLIFFPVIVVAVMSLLIHNTMGHRYYTLSYIFIAMLTLYSISKYHRKKYLLNIIVGLSFVVGNFIVYPDKISQGWDASLAHVHYWPLRKQMIDYINSQNINFANVYTYYGNTATIDDTDLSGDKRRYSTDENAEYVFASDVYNLTDEEIDKLDTYYIPIKRYSSFGVWVELMKKK